MQGTAPDARCIFVDSDNALGSTRGDIDDGIALATLLRSGIHVEAIASVFGNTSSEAAHRNNAALAERCGFEGPCLDGAATPGAPIAAAARRLVEHPDGRTCLALGPLTNVAQALSQDAGIADRLSEIVCLGSNVTSWGRWPPYWPFEYNFTKDPRALVQVFESTARITVVPLDQARRLLLRFADLFEIEGDLGRYLRLHARRWFRRAGWLKLRSTAPVWDLVAAMYVIRPDLFELRTLQARAHPNGWIEYGIGARSARVVVGFEPARVWGSAVEILNGGRQRMREPHV